MTSSVLTVDNSLAPRVPVGVLAIRRAPFAHRYFCHFRDTPSRRVRAAGEAAQTAPPTDFQQTADQETPHHTHHCRYARILAHPRAPPVPAVHLTRNNSIPVRHKPRAH